MRAKLYIVTYDNPRDLDETLASVFASEWHGHHLDVTVVSNHSRLEVRPDFRRMVYVIDNQARPDFSTGHLARSWNQCLVHGFRSLTAPDTDFVVTAQNDTLFDPRWFHRLVELHKTYSFVTAGAGDNFCSYLPDAVRAIGLWDERYCGIGYQEADYFLRAYLDNHERSSVNDYAHGRVLNPYGGAPLARRLHPPGQFDEHHLRSTKHHALCRNLFMRKWGPDLMPEEWRGFLSGPLPGRRSKLENYLYYPYFELDVHDLAGKNYFCDTAGVPFFNPAPPAAPAE